MEDQPPTDPTKDEWDISPRVISGSSPPKSNDSDCPRPRRQPKPRPRPLHIRLPLQDLQDFTQTSDDLIELPPSFSARLMNSHAGLNENIPKPPRPKLKAAASYSCFGYEQKLSPVGDDRERVLRENPVSDDQYTPRDPISEEDGLLSSRTQQDDVNIELFGPDQDQETIQFDYIEQTIVREDRELIFSDPLPRQKDSQLHQLDIKDVPSPTLDEYEEIEEFEEFDQENLDDFSSSSSCRTYTDEESGTETDPDKGTSSQPEAEKISSPLVVRSRLAHFQKEKILTPRKKEMLSSLHSMRGLNQPNPRVAALFEQSSDGAETASAPSSTRTTAGGIPIRIKVRTPRGENRDPPPIIASSLNLETVNNMNMNNVRTLPPSTSTPSPASNSLLAALSLDGFSSSASSIMSRGKKEKEKKKEKISKPRKPPTMFGVPLPLVLNYEGVNIPNIVRKTLAFLEAYLNTEGLFRQPGSITSITELKKICNKFEEVDFTRFKEPHTVASLLKLFIRELPEPLLTIHLYDPFLQVLEIKGEEEQINTLNRLIGEMPDVNRTLLSVFVGFLQKVTLHSSENKMTAANLATVFGPSLLWSPNKPQGEVLLQTPLTCQVVKLLILHYSVLFPSPQPLA